MHSWPNLLLGALRSGIRRLNPELLDASAATVHRAHHGLMASGDRFVSAAHESDRLRTALREAGHDVLAVEMEGAAVAQVCLGGGVIAAVDPD